MATAEDIQAVKLNLPPGYDVNLWSDDAIGALLDGGTSITKVVLSFWAGQVAKYSAVVDVSENGSSRSMSNLFSQAKDMYEIWLNKSKAEDDATNEVGRQRIRFHKAKRV